MENFTSLYDEYYPYDYNDSSLVYMEAGESESSFNLFSTVCYSLIFCLSVSGNSFLLWVLLRQRDCKTTSSFLLLHLTTSDLCFTVTLPFWAYYHLHGWVFGDFACKIISGAFFLGLYSYMAFLTAMTLDRYVAVVHAVSTSAQVRRKSCALLASVGIWLLCVAVSLMETVNSETRDDGFGSIECVASLQSLTMQLFGLYLQIGLFFLVPFGIITFCYVRMGMTIRRCRLRGRNQALRLFLGIIVGFFICWAPYNVVLFLQSLEMLGVQLLNTAGRREAMRYGYYVSHTLAYCHCCLNPLFHVFGAERFRRRLPLPCKTSSPGRERSQSLSTYANSQPHASVSQQV
ncbi:chemokine XC receptor 1 [Centroberyx gerrardi]|uniref:chemokine XC receptor 1 n=1 Tax=Centroberyx gerrardi TaxID=166262 RepID=UPI003AAB4375